MFAGFGFVLLRGTREGLRDKHIASCTAHALESRVFPRTVIDDRHRSAHVFAPVRGIRLKLLHHAVPSLVKPKTRANQHGSSCAW